MEIDAVSLTPIPDTHPLNVAQMVVEIATGAQFFACNCPSVAPARSLRFVAANRHLFSLPVPKAPANPTPKP